MKFLCDQMVAGLGRWLRAAGHDTAIACEGESDAVILERTLDENRLLLTCDTHFAHMKAPKAKILLLSGNSIEEWVKEINRELKVDWLYRPFSRCLECNEELTTPDERTITHQVPADVRARTSQFRYCPNCQKVYWEGSHTEKMRRQLEEWQKIDS